MKKVFMVLLFGAVSVMLAQPALAHCEVPCGIYDDKARIQMIHENSGTIVKAMNEIKKLKEADGATNYNQIVRWVNTKEKHADEIQEIVSQYFMTQRIKPTDSGKDKEKYIKQLTLLHKILIQAMKSKQSIMTIHPATIDTLTHEFAQSYFIEEMKGSGK